MAMTIDVEDLGGSPAVSVVALDGELDASNYERVIEVVRDAYGRGTRGLVLDLSKLSFMASSGLFALHSAFRIMRGETPPDPEAGWGALHEMAGDHDLESADVRIAAPAGGDRPRPRADRHGQALPDRCGPRRRGRGAPGSLTDDLRRRPDRAPAPGRATDRARAPGRPAHPADTGSPHGCRGRRLGDRGRLPAGSIHRRRLLRRLPAAGPGPAAPPRDRHRRRVGKGHRGGGDDGLRPGRDALRAGPDR